MRRIYIAASVIGLVCGVTGFLFFQQVFRDPEIGTETGIGNFSPDEKRPIKSKVFVYFSDESGDYLTAEERIVAHDDSAVSFAAGIVKSLIKGPESRKDLLGTIPSGTSLRSIFIDNGQVAYVDLSEQIEKNSSGGCMAELLMVYSIVNSVALNIPEIEAVKILVEGKEAETLAGHIDIRHPFQPDMYLVR